MATFTAGVDPVTIVRGRDWSMPMVWQTPLGAAINITGFGFQSSLTWPDGAADVTVVVTDVVNGGFVLSLTAGTTATIPEGTNSILHLTVTDTAGDTHDFVIPALGQTP